MNLIKAQRYSFILKYDYVDTTNPWSVLLDGTDRNEWGQLENGTYVPTYEIYEIGVARSGFYYKERIVTIVGNNQNVEEYTRHWGNTSGDFILNYVIPSYTDSYYSSIPNDVATMFELLSPSINENYDNFDVTYNFTNFDNTSQPQVIEINIIPHTHFVFIDNNIDILLTLSNKNDGDDGVVVVNSTSPYYSSFYNSVINIDGSATITITRNRDEWNFYSLYCILEIAIGDLSNVLIRDEFNVLLSSTGISFSNTSNIANTSTPYTNTLSLLPNYSWEESEIIITMNGEDVSYYYDSDTHIITIPQVTGDIVISAIAKSLKTFNFYSADGLTLYASVSAIRISKIRLELLGVTRKLYVNEDLITTYSAVIPDGYSLIGLSDTVNSDIYILPINVDYNEIFETDKNFYECVVLQPIIPSGFTLNLYQSSAENNHLDKTGFIHTVGTLSGTLRTSSNIVNPVIRIEYTQFPNFNYVYVPQFHRYYFVNEIVSVNRNIWDIVLHVDVLMSFKDVIRSQYAYIERNQYVFNKNEIDNMRTFENTPEYEYIEIQNDVFDVSSSGTTISGIDKDLRFVVTIVGN